MKDNIERRQTNFGMLYLGELKKTIFVPFTIGVIVVYLILLLVLHLMFNSLAVSTSTVHVAVKQSNVNIEQMKMPSDMDLHLIPKNFDEAYALTMTNARQQDGTYIFRSKEDIDLTLGFAKDAKADIRKQQRKEGIKFFATNQTDPYYALREKVNTLKVIKTKYIDKNIELKMSGSPAFFSIFGQDSLKYYDFYKLASGMLVAIIMIYGVVIGSRSYTTEFRSGSIKMLMVRPITRNQLTSAKILAVVTNVTVVYFITSLFTLLTGLRYGKGGSMTLFAFNASNFSLAPAGMIVLYSILIDYLAVISWTLLCFSIATITKNMIIGLVSYIFLPLLSTILHFIGVDLVSVATNMSWSAFLSGGTPQAIFSNFFITLVFWAIYVIGSVVLTYYIVNKRDLA